MNEQNNEQIAAFSFSAQFNKVSFSVDTTGFEYAKLGTLYEEPAKGKKPKVYKLDGLFVNKSPLGFSPVFIVSEPKQLVNMPQHLTETARAILQDQNAVKAIESGKVGFTVYQYEARGKQCYGVKFVDL